MTLNDVVVVARKVASEYPQLKEVVATVVEQARTEIEDGALESEICGDRVQEIEFLVMDKNLDLDVKSKKRKRT